MDLGIPAWRKATRSHDDGDQCIEVASSSQVIAIRDSKDPNGPKLIMTCNEFRYLTEAIKNR